MSDQKAMTIDTIERQRTYVKRQKEKGGGMGVVFADAFLRGMRDLGYKNPAWALAEQVDNAFQAGALTASIRFGFSPDNKTQVKPDFIAVVDDGNGMIPDMIGYAVRWGGTDREGDRNGFGRYGYGLPSSAVSLARRYTVYSKIPAQPWYAVTVDIDALAAAAGDPKRTDELLSPKLSKLPAWLGKGKDGLELDRLESGTVIILENLDRLESQSGWKKAETLKTKLLQQFGVIYRHWVPERRILVEGEPVQAVDPLFLMEHGRFFDESPVRAEAVDARSFEVETSRGTTGIVTIRASFLPPNFQNADPSQYGSKIKTNRRWEVMRDYNGLLVCRERRQIDTISPRFTKFQTYDANIKIEIDFDPELDELFGITTSKQQIEIDEAMWEKLQHSGKGGGGLISLVRDMRKRFRDAQTELLAKAANVAEEADRPSIVAMEKAGKFKDATPAVSHVQLEKKQIEAEQNIEHVAAEAAVITGRAKGVVLAELIKDISSKPWAIEFASIPEGPFYRPMRLGEQKRVVINTDHPFHGKMYDVSSPEVKAALEVLLLVLAERELDSIGDTETFYKSERQKWSERLRHSLNELVSDETMENKAAAVAERLQFTLEEA
jgi:hypothetical protein